MRKSIFLFALDIALALATTVVSANEEPSRQTADPSVRKDYGGANMPNGVALFNMMSAWEVVSERSPDDLSHHVKMVTPLDEESSKHLVSYLFTLNDRMNRDADSSVRMLICTPDVGSRSVEEYALVANTADDIAVGIYDKYYMMATAQLPADEVEALRLLLDSTKLSSSYVATDHSEDYSKRPVESIRHVLQTYCDQREY